VELVNLARRRSPLSPRRVAHGERLLSRPDCFTLFAPTSRGKVHHPATRARARVFYAGIVVNNSLPIIRCEIIGGYRRNAGSYNIARVARTPRHYRLHR